MDCSPPGSSHGILQARILEWVAISYSRESSWPRDGAQVSCLAGRFSTVESPGKPNCKFPEESFPRDDLHLYLESGTDESVWCACIIYKSVVLKLMCLKKEQLNLSEQYNQNAWNVSCFLIWILLKCQILVCQINHDSSKWIYLYRD